MNHWTSWSDFIAMGGYALYVWGSFGACAAVLAGEVFLLKLRRRALTANGAQGASDLQPINDGAPR